MGKIKSLREGLWLTLWDLGAARRRTGALLWKGGATWAARREVENYQAVALDNIEVTLSALDLPALSITIVSAFLGKADVGNFYLEDLEWAEEQLRREHEGFVEVD